jgi:hypothetical protein
MNTPEHEPDRFEQALVQRLRSLPPPAAPPPALWQRIDRSIARRRRNRRAAGGMALAAVIGLAAVLPGPWRTASLPEAAGLAEVEIAAPEPAALDPQQLAALHNELRHIDRQLEAAYLDVEGRNHIPRLWLLRQRIEQHIEDPRRAPREIIHL